MTVAPKKSNLRPIKVAKGRPKAIPGRKKLGNSPAAVKARQALFVEEYLVNGHNAKAAAAKAGWQGSNQQATGLLLLRNPHVQEMLEKRSRDVAEAAQMNTANWASEIRAVAFAKVGDLFTPEGRPLNPSELPAHVQSAVKSVRVSGRTVEYQMWNKPQALEMIAKHLGLFEQDNSQKVPDIIVDVRLVG